jgi:hypothetical protein
MTEQRGLDGRDRDSNGQIRQKNGNTKVETLRGIYGEEFAAGRRGDMKLENLLKEEGVRSLSEYLRES